MADAGEYTPRDSMYLWWIGTQPRLIAKLALVTGGRSVAVEYVPSWLESGFALSEDLPLLPGLFVPRDKGVAAGAVDDARPDRWGERVIRKFERSPRLSVLEFLLFAGDDRYGCLGVSLRGEAYEPWATAPMPTLASLQEMAEVVRKVLANEPVPELQRRLIHPGVSLGGARPKSLLSIDGEPWLVKFTEGEEMNTELVEHSSMTLAAGCGIHVAHTRALTVGDRHAIAVRRFDRAGSLRVHAISANVALRAAGEELGYPHLAQLLRRLAPADAIASQQQELFRRMVFNILMDNTDDHEKNHSLLQQGGGGYLLSPAFDVLPSASGLGVQAMLVGAAAAESSIDNALSQVSAFGLSLDAGKGVVAEVARQVEGWKEHFRQRGVSDADIDTLAQYIDGDQLRSQRRAASRDGHAGCLVQETRARGRAPGPPR